jgi:hypothetical protein
MQARIGGYALDGSPFEARRVIASMVHKLYIEDDDFNADDEGDSKSRLPFAHDIALLLLDKPVSTSRPLIRLPPSKSASRGLWALIWANCPGRCLARHMRCSRNRS